MRFDKRALVVLGVVLLLGFDHAEHATKAPLECRSCHAVDAKGKIRGAPGHAACFGACHGDAPKKPAKRRKKASDASLAARGPVCATCHAPAPRDLGVTMSHAGHDAATACAGCHTADGGASAKGHAPCAGCHAKAAAPAFDDCAGCHLAAPGLTLVAGPFALDGWSHKAHGKAAPKAGCKSCHTSVTAASTVEVFAPAKADCVTCHDGAAAFATTERCTTCHTAAPSIPPELARPTARFSHQEHRGQIGDCASCHGVDRRGEATVPGHRACADAPCHGGDFASTTPTTCAACHVAIEPWRALFADAPPPPTTEFGAEMPHRAHAKLALGCEGCHSVVDAARERRPPHGHASCTGDACHAAGRETPGPALDRCESCHRAGLVEARVQERLAARWTVRARFDHDAHSGGCDTCHGSVWTVDGPPPTPEKAACTTCHDGKAAFKMTGHGCAKCHGG